MSQTDEEELGMCCLCLREKHLDHLILMDEEITHQGHWRATYVCSSCERRMRELAQEEQQQELPEERKQVQEVAQ